MVVAELPLWVVHSNTNNPGAKSTSVAVSAGGGESSAPNPQSADTSTERGKQRALESLSLLDNIASSKAAIYSVDASPCGSKFATGGGDGTVRIWNAAALFVKPKNDVKARFESTREQLQQRLANDMSATMTSGVGNVTYESSGESSADDNVVGSPATPPGPKAAVAAAGGGGGSSSDSSKDGDEAMELVHDLTNVVRRKKDGSSPTKKLAAASNLTRNTSLPHHHHHKHNLHHRLLCTLSAHTGSSVLAVRFSTHGKYLASAGDDAVVCIYAQQISQNEETDGNNLESSVEQWTRIKLCRGHGLDAVGLAWAPDDSHLVSCSLDSSTPIIVWKLTDLAENRNNGHHRYNYSNVICNPYKILGRGIHTSTVKGVTFDPAGTYLASSGDDPSVCIWRAHDDWGLEKRIDASSGIFRQWSRSGSGGGMQQPPTQDTSSQSLFRRLSWSTDGAYICSTNGVVKNKHVASTIGREGWAVSSAKSTATGAANLVGHKQPVVASRHCPYLLKNANRGDENDVDDDDDDDDEPEYATLLALGDKRGFVTVWSTRKSRPVFKIQCSETRSTVTDLTWGRVMSTNLGKDDTSEKDLMLLVSLLDGQVVALRFGVPDELGHLLKPEEQARVFQLRYGIDLTDANDAFGGRRLFVGGNSGPKLIENALQFSLEQSNDDDHDDSGDDHDASIDAGEQEEARRRAKMTADEVKANQSETRSKGGKKRIQPLLMQTSESIAPKRQKTANGSTTPGKSNTSADTLENAMELAAKAASGAEAAASLNKTQSNKPASEAPDGVTATAHSQTHHHNDTHHEQMQTATAQQNLQILSGTQATPQIPHSTDRIHSVELPILGYPAVSMETNGAKHVADCTNSIQVPQGSVGGAVKCAVLSISKEGQKLWKDQLPGTACSAIAASKAWLVVGTADGCVHIYGTSPTLGWESGISFRSHPPFVLGHPVISLYLREVPGSGLQQHTTEMVVVSSDGRFGVYSLEPNIRVLYKGSIMPAMKHMLLSADLATTGYLPKLARLQLTEKNRLLLLLSLQTISAGRAPAPDEGRGGRDGGRRGDQQAAVGAGGSLQGFVYDLPSELWMRVADSRFVLSDFYNTLPLSSTRLAATNSSKKSLSPPSSGELTKLADSVLMGASSSTLRRSRRGASFANIAYTHASQKDDVLNDIASRSHCEDRMACALALGSAEEFEYWFSMYIKTLAVAGDESTLRLIVDMLMAKSNASPGEQQNTSLDVDSGSAGSWWLSGSTRVLKFDRVQLIKNVVIPEMSKNRSLQRYTNEVNIEVNALD